MEANAQAVGLGARTCAQFAKDYLEAHDVAEKHDLAQKLSGVRRLEAGQLSAHQW
jgi:hypothetical protein